MAREHQDASEKTGSKNITKVIVAIVIVGLLGGIGYLAWQNNELRNNPKTSAQAASNKANDVKTKVGKLISVPGDETPTLATVTDKTKLKDQPFFKDAENGDTILIFPQAKKAIIYRESENKLINVGPIAITSDAAAKGGTTPATPEKK